MTARLPARLLCMLCAVLPLTLGAAPAGTVPLSAFPRERIAVETRASFRRHLFEAWRAETPQTREQGFMFVEDREVRADQAMIFIYDPPQYVAMWMKNTPLPLSVAFVDGEGRILNILDMEPHTLDQHMAAGPARYALETHKGWFAQRRIKPGDKVAGLPKPK